MGIEAVAKAKGWKSRKRVVVEFFRCPECGGKQELLGCDADEKAMCFHCEKKHPKDSFTRAKLERFAVECAECGAEVTLTSANCNEIGCLCSDCQNYVAIRYGSQFVNTTEALDPEWNLTLEARGEKVGTDTILTRVASKRDVVIVRLLQIAAKEEDERFLYFRPEDQKAAVYLDAKRRKYLGFIVWSANEHAVLRQIYVVPDQRRRGLGETLVKFWVTRYAERLGNKFGIEAPNEKSIRLHLKLGHLTEDGKRIRGVKCFFAGSM